MEQFTNPNEVIPDKFHRGAISSLYAPNIARWVLKLNHLPARLALFFRGVGRLSRV